MEMSIGQRENCPKYLVNADFRSFIAVISKAKEACTNSGQDPAYHFVDFNEMIEIGKGGKRQVESVIKFILCQNFQV